MQGVVEIDEAKRLAREAGLDLVEVVSNSTPPVVRIIDYGKYKYEQSKKDRANKAKSKGAELKEIRMGRSMKIDPHDIEIRLDQARRFLMEGHKVQIVQNFRGREMMHRQRGHDRMKDIIDSLSDVGKIETSPRFAGRRMTMIIAPDRAKIQRIKGQQEAIKQNADKPADDENVDASKPKEAKAKATSSPVVPTDLNTKVAETPTPVEHADA